jgi:tRNA/rRNA methyltransferase
MSNDEMSHCHWLMHIPTRVEHESMNLGQAVAVCLYEIVRAEVETLEAKKPRRHAKLEDLDRIEELLLGVLTESGYVQELTRQSAEHKIRRMLRRLELTSADVPIWLGALRQIRWRIQRGGAADD